MKVILAGGDESAGHTTMWGMPPCGACAARAVALVSWPLGRMEQGGGRAPEDPAHVHGHTVYSRVHTCSGVEARLSVECSCPPSPLRADTRMVYLLPGSRALQREDRMVSSFMSSSALDCGSSTAGVTRAVGGPAADGPSGLCEGRFVA